MLLTFLFLIKILHSTDEELKQLIDTNEYNFRFEAGMNLPSAAMGTINKGEIAKALAMHYVIYSSMAELEHIKKGLRVLGVQKLMSANITTLKPLFCKLNDKLSAASFVNLFDICWSPLNTTKREEEEGVILAWTEYVMNTEGKFYKFIVLKVDQ